MFHLHVLGAIEGDQPWLSGYDGSKYSNAVMGKWFELYSRHIRIYLLFINHPVHPV